MMIIDEMSSVEIESSVVNTFYKVCCHSKDHYTTKQWKITCNLNVPQMCDAVAVESFRRDWMPAGTQVVREVLDRLTYAGDWTTPLDEQISKVEL